MAANRYPAKIRALAPDFRDRCALNDVHLVAGEAEEILHAHVRAVAQRLGVTERTVLQNYMNERAIADLVAAVGRAGAAHSEAVSTADPVTISATDLGAVMAALGMALKLAAQAFEDSSQFVTALGITTDAADAIVGLGAALRETDNQDKVMLDGWSVIHARSVLQSTLEHLRDRTWSCSCRDQHVVGRSCWLQDLLARDLGLIGGWPNSENEPPAVERGPDNR